MVGDFHTLINGPLMNHLGNISFKFPSYPWPKVFVVSGRVRTRRVVDDLIERSETEVELLHPDQWSQHYMKTPFLLPTVLYLS